MELFINFVHTIICADFCLIIQLWALITSKTCGITATVGQTKIFFIEKSYSESFFFFPSWESLSFIQFFCSLCAFVLMCTFLLHLSMASNGLQNTVGSNFTAASLKFVSLRHTQS